MSAPSAIRTPANERASPTAMMAKGFQKVSPNRIAIAPCGTEMGPGTDGACRPNPSDPSRPLLRHAYSTLLSKNWGSRSRDIGPILIMANPYAAADTH